MRKTITFCLAFLFLYSCSQVPELPEVEFPSPTTARVIYKGREYLLEKGAPPPEDFPFPYRFEEDGDLDLKIAGRWVEFDNPYDIDIEIKTPRLLKRPRAKTSRYQRSSGRSKRARRK